MTRSDQLRDIVRRLQAESTKGTPNQTIYPDAEYPKYHFLQDIAREICRVADGVEWMENERKEIGEMIQRIDTTLSLTRGSIDPNEAPWETIERQEREERAIERERIGQETAALISIACARGVRVYGRGT